MALNRFKFILTKKLFPDAIPVYHPPVMANLTSVANTTNKESNQRPLILLLGWGGSSRKNLRKLIQYYNDTGYGVISHTMSMSAPGFCRDYIEDLIANEVDIQLHQQPSQDFVCHLYSNNGTWVYASLMQKKAIPLPKLAIWDSAPFLYLRDMDLHYEASSLSRVFISAFLRKPIYTHPILSPILYYLLKAYISFNKFLEKIEGNLHIVPKLYDLHQFLIAKPPQVPTVFIYSTGDKLIPPSNVERYLKYLDKYNFKYTTKVFGDNCGHTSSFYVQPEEYKSFIEPYLNNVTQKKQSILE